MMMSNMGKAALFSHASGQCRIKLKEASFKGTVSISDILHSSSAKPGEPGQAHTSTSDSSTSTVTTVESPSTSGSASAAERSSTCITPSETLSAEILWALKVSLAHYSTRSCDNAGIIFRRVFPDSQIAQKVTCGRTKCHYLTKFAPHFKNLLMQRIKDSGDVVVLFDESLNCITNRKQMDVHARLWVGRQVGSRCHGLPSLNSFRRSAKEEEHRNECC